MKTKQSGKKKIQIIQCYDDDIIIAIKKNQMEKQETKIAC